jgi:hypothetical protein
MFFNEKFEVRKTQQEVTYELQQFANAFFKHLEKHGLCPMLNSLAIGMFWEPNSNVRLLADEYHVPRHCFIKGYQIDFMNRRRATAIPVSAYTLQHYEPESDILDFDPDCNWLGGLSGRLRER